MKKFIALLFFAAAFASQSIAQPGKNYEDLLKLFVDDKFEKCLYKAEGYTLDEKTKKDPLPYLYMSRCYFEMSKRDEFREKYPNAFKDAMKYASKYGSKDKEKQFAAEFEDYFGALRMAAIAEAETMMETNKASKAKQIYDNLLDLDPNDAGAQLSLGLAFQAAKSKKESEDAFKKAKAILSEKKASTTKEQLILLKDAITKHATALASSSKEAAREWLELGMEYFPEDKEYKLTYDTIIG